MDRRTAYTSRRTASLKKSWIGMALLGAVIGLVLLVWLLGPDQSPVARSPLADDTPARPAPSAALPSAAPAPASAVTAPRRIYPYSIIPGGVADREQLASVIKTDKVVAEHYSSFAVGKAFALTVSKPRAVYVSYRKGDQVYWTARKLMLVEGEILLSDGRSEMRARCANRISDVPQFPVAPDEPAAEEFDSVLAIAMDPDDSGFNGTDPGAGGAMYGTRLALAGSQSQSDSNPARVSRGSGAPAARAPFSGRTSNAATAGTPTVVAPSKGEGTGGGTPGPSTPPGTELPTPTTPGVPPPAPDGTTPSLPDGPGAPPPASPGGEVPPPGGELPPGIPETPVPPLLPPESPPLPPTDLPPAPGVPVHELPEPATLGLFAAAFAAMLLLRRKRARN